MNQKKRSDFRWNTEPDSGIPSSADSQGDLSLEIDTRPVSIKEKINLRYLNAVFRQADIDLHFRDSETLARRMGSHSQIYLFHESWKHLYPPPILCMK